MARVESDTSSEGEAPPPAPGSQHDDSSISSDEEDETVYENNVTALENNISANPYVYTEHVDLIRNLHQLGNMSRLRTAYERLSKICPMSPSQWLHWLQLEVKNATDVESRNELHKLFHRAFIDCYSIHIYTEWCAMSLSNGEGETDARTILKEALKLAGSDPVDGAMIWDTAREFELALLYVMETSSADYSSQVMRIFDIFNNQLSRPLLQAEKTVEEFRTFAEIMDAYIPDSEELVKKIENAHQISEDILKKLLDYENELEDTKDNETKVISEKCATYVNYIDYAKTLLDDDTLHDCGIINLLGVLYDRVTSECVAPAFRGEASLPEQAEKLSIDYIEYAREFGTDDYHLNVIEKVIKRFCRKSSFWILKLQQLERMKRDFSEIKSEFESSLFCGFDTADDYVSLWLCYLEILRRYTDFSSQDQIEIIRKSFRLSWDSLSQMWGDEADTEFIILQFWARLEYQHIKDYKYGQEICEEILSYGDNKLRGGLWHEYIFLERISRGCDVARTLYRRAVRVCADPRLQRAWLALERDHGTLDTLNECVAACSAKAKEWKEQQSKAYNQNDWKKHGKTANNTKDNNTPNKNKSNKKKKGSFADMKKEKSAKQSNNTNNDSHNKKRDASPTRMEVDEVETVKDKNNIEDRLNDANNTNANEGIKRKSNDTTSGGTPVKKAKYDKGQVSGKPPPGYNAAARESPNHETHDDEEKNNRTAFISNLDFEVKEETLRKKLCEFGSIAEIRLIAGVKSFGSICYCVYEDPKSVDVALSHDRALLNDRPMFISRYCSSKDSRKTHFTYSTGIERNKLFVKNLSFEHCTDEKLRKVFGQYGNLKDIRIVTHKTGKPKGLAYIEYYDEASASKALAEADGYELGGRALNIAFSAPPPRKTPINPTLNSSARGNARTMLFVPSVLQKAPPTNDSILPSSSKSANANLSNSDFRNLLLQKK